MQPYPEVGILLGHDDAIRADRKWYGPRSQDWNLILAVKGVCRVTSGKHFLCMMTAGNVMLFPPGTPRSYLVREEWECYWCHFVTSLSIQWPQLESGCFQLCAPKEVFSVMLRDIREAAELYSYRPVGWHPLAIHLIEGILLRGNMKNCRNELSRQIQLARNLLDDPESGVWDMSQLARKCGLSRSAFFQKFRDYIGVTPGVYRERRILQQAASLLESTDLTLEEIARKIGFSDLYYFAHRFKAAYQMPPGVYRKRIRLSGTPEEDRIPPALI